MGPNDFPQVGPGIAAMPGVATVDDDGQIELARELQLTDQDLPLHVARRMVVVIIESDFANRHQLRMRRELSELVEMAVPRLRGLVRVNARRGVNPLVSLGNPHGLAQAVGSPGPADGQQILQPGATRALDHGVAVRVKVGIVEVAVGVDVHKLKVEG